MEFKASVEPKHKFVRLQFYGSPPTETIELSELEEYAVDRLRALKCVETLGQDYVRGSKEYDEKLTFELSKLGSFGKALTLPSSSPKNAKEDIRKDIMSHFILQVAYCRSEDLRRWFIHQELDLFRYRFLNERNSSMSGPSVLAKFLAQNDLHFSHISDLERSSLNKQLISGTSAPCIDPHTTAFYKVHFTEVAELIRNRRVFVRSGYAYVPDPDVVSLVVSHFRVSLSCNLARLGLTLGSRLVSEENRVLPLLSSISNRYLGEDYSNKISFSETLKSEQVDVLAKQPGVFPPCMSQLHEALRSQHHLRHAGRMQYGLFLKGIGLPLEEALKFWRNSFAPKCDSDQFAKSYAYNIRHNYGKEGKRTDYTPYSCVKIISGTAPGAGEYHGCPFRHMDPELLKQRLSSGGRLSPEAVDNIVQRAKERLYHLSCREYFRSMHKLSVDDITGITIHHPNQYFEESQKIISGIEPKPLSVKAVKKVKLSDNKSTIIDGDDDEMNDMTLLEASLMNDTQMTSDLSFIDVNHVEA